MPKKEKLSKEQRSQIAKDRWKKRKAAVVAQDSPKDGWIPVEEVESLSAIPAPVTTVPAQGEYTGLSGRDENGVPSIVGLGDGTIKPNGVFVPDQPPIPAASVIPEPPVASPAPQLAPVRAPKPKRYTGPKEFSVALKAAEGRLAKAIVERAQAAGQLAALQAEIPSLLGIIQALKGSQNYTPPAPYDLSGGVPNAIAYQAPLPQAPNPLAAIQAAMAAPPASRASGGAVQFGPEVTGALEGPEDDDIDKYITGASGPVAEGKWIGG